MNLYDAFAQAIALPTLEQQQQFILELRDQSKELAQKLAQMLTAAADAGDYTLDVKNAVEGAANQWCTDDISTRLTGMKLGVWQLDKLLAQGGMSAVYLASRQDGQFEQSVAVKVLNPLIYPVMADSKAFDEAGLCARLNHAAITTMLDAGVVEFEARRAHYIVMEYVDGLCLQQWLEQKKPTLKNVLQLMAELCGALHYAHTHQVIHADIKPANILVDAQGHARLIDFGISQLHQKEPVLDRQVQRYVRAMSLGFASPEQLQALPLSTLSDVYSLGKVLEFALVIASPPALQQQELRAIVQKATAEQAGQRYLSMRDFQQDLHAVLNHFPVIAFKNTAAYRLRKFVSRQPWVSGFVMTTIISLVIGVTGISIALLQVEQQRKVAEQASADERKRAEELEQVVAFQSEQLKEIDPLRFGQQIRQQVFTGLGVVQATNQQIPLQALEQLNFTDIGVNALDETVFEQSIAAIHKQFAQQPETQASLLQSTAMAMLELGLATRSLDTQNKAVALYESALGAEHPKTLKSKTQLAKAYFNLGEFEQAAFLAKAVLALQKNSIEPAYADILVTMNTYGLILTAQSKLSEAEQVFMQSLALAEQVQSFVTGTSLLEIHNNLGIVYYHLDQLEASLYHIGKARDGHRELYGEESLKFITNSLNYAAVLMQMGDSKPALEVFASTSELAEKVLGTEHPHTLINKGNYANLLLQSGDLATAEKLFKECLAVGKKALGIRHSAVIIWHDNLATTLYYADKVDESLFYYQEALRLSVETVGEMHLSTIDTKGKLARTLLALGNEADAEVLLQSAYDALVETGMTKHRHFLSILNSQAILLRQKGRLEESIERSEQVFQLNDGLLSEKNHEWIAYSLEYGITLLKLNKLQQALHMLEPVQAKLHEQYGREHRLSKKATLHLRDLYQKMFDATDDLQYQDSLQLLAL